MAVLLRVTLFFTVVFVSFTGAQHDFNNLPELYKKGVEVAVTQINSHPGVQNHFLFFKSLSQSSIEAGFGVKYFYHNFYLKATKCSRDTKEASSEKCAFRNDRPLIDCAICYKTFGEEIEKEPKPYIHCVHKPVITEEMKKAREEHCNKMGYSSGAPTLLASSKHNK